MAAPLAPPALQPLVTAVLGTVGTSPSCARVCWPRGLTESRDQKMEPDGPGGLGRAPPQHPPPCPSLQVHPGVPPLTWVPRSSSLLQVVGSHQVILRDDPNGVVELPDPPAVHVVLLGRHSRGGGLVLGQRARPRSRPSVAGFTESSPHHENPPDPPVPCKSCWAAPQPYPSSSPALPFVSQALAPASPQDADGKHGVGGDKGLPPLLPHVPRAFPSSPAKQEKSCCKTRRKKNRPFAAAWNLGELPRMRGLGPHPRREEEPPAPALPRPEHDEVF